MTFVQRIIDNLEKTSTHRLLIFILLLGFSLYGNSLLNGFVWDDEEQIVNNSIIQRASNIPYLFTASTFNTGGAGLSGWYYKPLMSVVFSLNYAVFGNNPFAFHLFDLMLHLFNTFLIFFLFRKLFTLQKFRFPKLAALLLSLIFLTHPANSESVLYIASTQELLYTLFMLLALVFTIKFIEDKRISLIKVMLINLAVLFSLLSKESGVVTIPVIVLYAFLFKRNKTFLLTATSLITFIFYLLLRYPLAKTPFLFHSPIIPIANASFWQRMQTIPFEIFSYLRLIFFPRDLFVAQHFVIKNVFDPRFFLALPLTIGTFLILVFLYLKFKLKLLLFFLSWLFFSFFLILNIYPLDMTLAERWLYGPLIAVLGILGILISLMFKNNNNRQSLFYFFCASILVIFFLSLRTFTRTFDWRNNLALFSHDIKYSNSFDNQNNLGVALFRNGDLKNAKYRFEQSIKLSPNWWTPYNNLGAVYQREGKLEEAKRLYSVSIKKGNYYLAYENLAILKLSTEKPKDVIPFIKESLSRLPNNEILNKVAAIVFFKEGQRESARIYAERTFAINQTQDNYQLLQKIINN